MILITLLIYRFGIIVGCCRLYLCHPSLTQLFFVIESNGLYYTNATTKEEIGRPTIANKRQRLSRDGEYTDRHCHIDNCLKENQCTDTSHTKTSIRMQRK